jgi:hypothetical protein
MADNGTTRGNNNSKAGSAMAGLLELSTPDERSWLMFHVSCLISYNSWLMAHGEPAPTDEQFAHRASPDRREGVPTQAEREN